MPRFTMPRDVHYGRESIERLSELRGKRAMLVAASEEKRRGLLRARKPRFGAQGWRCAFWNHHGQNIRSRRLQKGLRPCAPLRRIGL